MKHHAGDRQFHTNHEGKQQFVNGWECKILISTVTELLNSCHDGTNAPLCWRRMMKNNTLLSKMSNTATRLSLNSFQGYTAFSCNTQLVHAYFSGSRKITIHIPRRLNPQDTALLTNVGCKVTRKVQRPKTADHLQARKGMGR